MRCLKVCNKRKLYDEWVGLVQDLLYGTEMGWGLKRLLSAVNVIVPAFIRPHPIPRFWKLFLRLSYTITPKSLLHAEQYFTLLCEALRFRGAEIYENLINLIKMLWGKSLNQRVADGKMNYQAFLPCLAGCLWANWVTAKLWAEMFYSLSKYIHFIVHSILWARGKGKVAIPKVTKSAYNRWAIMGVFRP